MNGPKIFGVAVASLFLALLANWFLLFSDSKRAAFRIIIRDADGSFMDVNYVRIKVQSALERERERVYRARRRGPSPEMELPAMEGPAERV